MPVLPLISGQECAAALAKIGFVLVRQRGSHMALRRDTPPPARTVIVPDHDELDRGTLRSIIRQAGLTVQEFLDLLD
jgi:predicted RNA binding protein YcfA (HicA-like mRNA interferase family)